MNPTPEDRFASAETAIPSLLTLETGDATSLFKIGIENASPEQKREAVAAFRKLLLGKHKRKPRVSADENQGLLWEHLRDPKKARRWFRLLELIVTKEMYKRLRGPLPL